MPRSRYDDEDDDDLDDDEEDDRYEKKRLKKQKKQVEETARRRCLIPGILLLVTAAMTLLGNVAWTVLEFIGLSQKETESGVRFFGAIFAACPGVFGVLFSIGILIGGIAFLRVTNTSLARLGCILALIPCHAGFPVGIVAAIFGFVVLGDSDVKLQFYRNQP